MGKILELIDIRDVNNTNDIDVTFFPVYVDYFEFDNFPYWGETNEITGITVADANVVFLDTVCGRIEANNFSTHVISKEIISDSGEDAIKFSVIQDITVSSHDSIAGWMSGDEGITNHTYTLDKFDGVEFDSLEEASDFAKDRLKKRINDVDPEGRILIV